MDLRKLRDALLLPRSFGVVAIFLGLSFVPLFALRLSAGDAHLPFIRGDCNSDGTLGISDPLFLLYYLLGPNDDVELACIDAGDVTDDETVNLVDPIYLLAYLFNGGAAIPPPASACGLDETSEDALPCNESSYCAGAAPLPTIDDGGWTVIDPAAGTLVVYVSNSEGNDANDGLSPAAPKATLAAGYDLLRDGYPDWLLLKRGDEWEEVLPDWQKSGESELAPMLVSSYGDSGDRPVLKTGNDQGFVIINGNNLPVLSHIAIVGLRFYAHTRDPNNADFSVPLGNVSGFYVLHRVEDFLIEDCLVEFYGQGITITGEDEGHDNVRVRRCVVADSYATDSNAEGAFFANTNGLVIEECIFDHNGWNAGVAGAVPNIFRHSIYIYGDCSEVEVSKNIITRSASHGAQLRTGGVFDDNVLIENSIGVAFWEAGTVHGNVILKSKDIDPSTPRAVGIWVQETTSSGVSVDQNIIANDIGAEWGTAITVRSEIGSGVDSLTINNNTICAHKVSLQLRGFAYSNLSVSDNVFQCPEGDWVVFDSQEFLNTTDYAFDGNVYYSSASMDNWISLEFISYPFDEWEVLSGEVDPVDLEVEFEDPSRDVVTYQESIGGVASESAFYSEVRLQAKHFWRAEYGVQSLLDYFRAGFTPVTVLGAGEPGAVTGGSP